LPTLRAALAASVDDTPAIGDTAFRYDKLKERPGWNLGLWHTEYDGPTLLAHIEGVAKSWRHQIEARKDAWARALTADHFSSYCEKRRGHYRSHIERLLADFELESRAKNKAANITELIAGQMKESLRGLELALANAIASVS